MMVSFSVKNAAGIKLLVAKKPEVLVFVSQALYKCLGYHEKQLSPPDFLNFPEKTSAICHES